MKILDENGKEIVSPDLDLGYLKPDRLLIQHHEAVPEAPAVTHLEEHKYPNGSADYTRIIDVPYQPAQEAWDEYEDIMRYIPYTPEEIEERKKPTQMDIIEAQVSYTAMMTDTVLEV